MPFKTIFVHNMFWICIFLGKKLYVNEQSAIILCNPHFWKRFTCMITSISRKPGVLSSCILDRPDFCMHYHQLWQCSAMLAGVKTTVMRTGHFWAQKFCEWTLIFLNCQPSQKPEHSPTFLDTFMLPDIARQQSKVKSSIEPVFIDLDTLKIFSSGIPPHKKKKVFCFQNCSDLLWEKIILVNKKKFWN